MTELVGRPLTGKPPDDPHRLLDSPAAPVPQGYLPGEPTPGEILVHFADDPRKLYQLVQWVPVLDRLHERHPVLLVTRQLETFQRLGRLTSLPCVMAPTFPDLMDLYEHGRHKVVLYVNNSVLNFQSLVARHLMHVHLNHGESDKVCMVSNQAKAYDRVFVAGGAAVQRHRGALLDFDLGRLVRVGRAQLDLQPAPVLEPTSRRTVLYAPTWEGEEAGNNYTSVDVFGPQIVSAVLAVPDVRVVYKPHPRVAMSPDPSVAAGHRKVLRLLQDASLADPNGGHRAIVSGDILGVFPGCDALITDVSSVALDFLYLRRDRPLFVADRYDDRDLLHAGSPVCRCADVVDSTSLAALAETLASRLEQDVHRAGRDAMRRHYFGDLAPGESTERFLAAVGETVRIRDALMTRLAVTDHPAGVTEARTGAEPVAKLPPVEVAILAAGLGTRLGLQAPKALTPLVNGQCILGRQLDGLRQAFGDGAHIAVVVGFRADQVMAAFPDVRFVYNERFAETNTAKSLLRALRTSPEGGVLWLNGDVVFDAALLDVIAPVVAADRSFVCVNTAAVGEEEVKYRVDAQGYVSELSKSVTHAGGEAVGINYIAGADKALLIEHLERCAEQDYFESALESAIVADGMRVLGCDISDYFAVQVDFASDLERVNAEVSRTVTSAA